MTSTWPLVLALCLTVCLATAATARPRELFVAAAGRDTWSGALPAPNKTATDGPFATLDRAAAELRALRAQGRLPQGATVSVRAGTYYLGRPFQLGPADAGTAEAPVTFRAQPGEKVVLSGGKPVRGWQPYQGKIVRADIRGLGIAEPPRQLFFAGRRQTLARWPNENPRDEQRGEWAYVASIAEEGSMTKFRYLGDRPRRWARPTEVEVAIWPNYNWFFTTSRIAEVDLPNRVITLAESAHYAIEPGRRYFYQNALEELDAPGEWYYDRHAGWLYFWPPAPLRAGEVVLPLLDDVVAVKDSAFVTIQGFTIEACRGRAAAIMGGHDCRIAACTITATGAAGLAIDGGTHNGAVGNDIFETGLGGITLAGGDRQTLEPAGNYADNNHIHHFARLGRTYHTGVNVSGVGNRISHNLIHDAPHIAILLHGNEHVIEFNDLHHVCLEGADNGAFYMGRDWTQRGNVVRFNRIHDIVGYGLANPDRNGKVYHYESPHWAWGVYLDDCSSGTTVYGNLVYRVPLCGVLLGGGRDNVVQNNVFVDCSPVMQIDDRWDSFPWDLMGERLRAMNYTAPPYSVRYPQLLDMGDARTPANNRFQRNIVVYRRDDIAGIVSTDPKPDSAVLYNLAGFDPQTDRFDHNLVWHDGRPIRLNYREYKGKSEGAITWQQWQAKGFDAGSLVADPRFVNEAADDYQLRPDSPAWQLGWQPLPLDRIGLYQSDLRATWPVPNPRRPVTFDLVRETVTLTE